MHRIRTKLIILFAASVLLPIIPLAWLVGDLVQQSYRIGVNPEVEAGLQEAVDLYRRDYQRRKRDLEQLMRSAVEQFISHGTKLTEALPETVEWQYRGWHIYDSEGRLINEVKVSQQPLDTLDSGRLSQAEDAPSQSIVLGDRAGNRFFAVYALPQNHRARYWVLQAALEPDFLASSDRLLRLYQTYRALSLAPLAIPQRFLYAFVSLSLFLLLIVMGVAVLISNRLTRPIRALVEGTREIGKGNLDYRIPRQSQDELGDLVDRFNNMAVELQNFQERTIFLEKMAAWQEIARRLAHEIKNPLTPIQLTMQEMVDQYQGENDEYRRLLQECHGIVNEEINNLRNLVREFSDFARMPELQRKPGQINKLIRELVKMYPHLQLDVELEQDLPEYLFDEDRMRRVLINLIENAAQADPHGRPIVIAARQTGNGLEISVKDHGSGIDPQLRERIFQPYFTTKNNGIGLGLAITRKIIEEHDGQIRVESELGAGSRFIITLPLLSQNSPSESPGGE